MSTSPQLDGRERQLRLACAELDRRLHAGEEFDAAQAMKQHPELAEDDSAALELIYAEFAAREQLGQNPSVEDFCTRYDNWKDDLREQLRIHNLLSDCIDDDLKSATSAQKNREPTSDAAGRKVAHYMIGREIGRGGMGVVYLARDEKLGRLVALKLVLGGAHADQREMNRLRREADTIARLQHPNFVQVYEIGESDGHPYVVLEYVRGTNLANRLEEGSLEPRNAARLVTQLARAMHLAHQKSIIHRDLKPSNILLSEDGTAKITDLGLAKRLLDDDDRTRTGALVGTPSYMAPELAGATRYLGPPTDVYSLGAILYHALAGRPPFAAENSLETIQQVVYEEPIPPRRLQAAVPRDLATICMKCLRKSPHSRYPSAEALAADIDRFLQDRPIEARQVSPAERVWLWARRRPVVAVLSGVLMLVFAALMIGGLWYNWRLQLALEQSDRNLSRVEVQRRESKRQTELAKQQLQRTRHSLYALQLVQVQQLWRRDPGRGLELLQDENRCPPEFRDFTWKHFHRLCDRNRFRLSGIGQVTAAYSPDGMMLVVADENGVLRLHDPHSGKLKETLSEAGPAIHVVAFSYDSTALAVGREGGFIELWDLENLPVHTHIDAHPSEVHALAFSPFGNTLVSAGDEKAVRLWDVLSGQQRMKQLLHDGPITSLAFGTEDRTLATSGPEDPVRIWNLKTRQAVTIQEAPGRRAMVFSPDGATLAIGGEQETVALYEPRTGKKITELFRHASPILALTFSVDGEYLVSGSKDKSVKIWDVIEQRVVATLKGHEGEVHSVSIAPDGVSLVSSSDDTTARIWNIAPRPRYRRFRGHAQGIVAVAFSPDSRLVASSGFDQQLRIWDVASGQLKQTLTPVHRARGIIFSHDGQTMITASEDRLIRFWRISDGTLLNTVKGHSKGIFDLALSPDGQVLATTGNDGDILLWDATTGDLQKTIHAHNDYVSAVEFSPDGKTLATASRDRLVKLWNVADGKQRAELRGHTEWIHCLAFSPNGEVLATGGADETVRFWNPTTGKLISTLRGHSQYVVSMTFSRDGKTLATGSGDRWQSLPGEVKLWDAKMGYVRATLEGENGPVAFAPNGRILATGGNDGSIKLWTTASFSP